MMTATEWFDQFPLDGIGTSEQWCARHWAPAPRMGANGLGATIELIAQFTASLPAGATAKEANELLRRTGKVCCTLGDQAMYDIWGHWPPAPASTSN